MRPCSRRGKVLLPPMELLEKLTALVPPPRFHLLRYHGVLAPYARDRGRIVPIKQVEESTAVDRDSSAPPYGHRLGYSEHSRTIRCDDKRFIRYPAGLLRTFSANCILPISVPYFSYTFQLPLRKGPVRFAVTKKTGLSPNSWRAWVGRHGDVYIASWDHHQGSSLDETSCRDGLAVHRPAHHLVGRLAGCNN